MGLKDQFGMATESVWGTFVTPTRFLEYKSSSIKPVYGTHKPTYLGRARTLRGANVVRWIEGGSGAVVFDVMTAGFGLLFKQMLGSVATTGSGPYTHTFTPDMATLIRGLSSSVQVGVQDEGGTVRPFNFAGGKIVSWGLSCSVGNPLELTTTWDFDEGFETTTALGTASFPTATPYLFVHGVATIGGSTVFIPSVQLSGDNGLKTDRRGLGNVKKEQLANARLAVTGNLEFEFENLTRQGQLTSGTLIDDLVLTFTKGANTLTISVPQFVYDDGTPESSGPEINMQPMPFEATDNGSDPLISIVAVNSDATP